MMKNLFNYATKELSQDAFLRWLFESYEDEDIKPCVRVLLNEFCGIDENVKITAISTRAQWEKIDIEVDVVAEGERYLLYIEDKTWSEAHNQLKEYSKAISDKVKSEGIGENNVKKIFYKTYLTGEQDKRETKENDWIPYDIDALYKLFAPFAKSNNIILKQYIEHLSGIYHALHNSQRPQKNKSENLLNWEGYFGSISRGIIAKHGYQNSGAWRAGHYPYICLILRKNDCYPYLEIRSRDFASGEFTVYLLLYGVKDKLKLSECEFEKRQKALKDKVKEAKSFFRAQNYKQQVAKYTAEGEIATDEALIAELERCADFYDELMLSWDEILREK